MKAEPPPRSLATPFPVPPGGTATAAKAHDWSTTPLGPAESWPHSLKTAASIVLGSNVPMLLAWGPDLLLIHNDSYGEILGDRRPALGRPLRSIWSDIWPIVEGNVERVLRGETVFLESAPRPLKRRGVRETAWITSCYSPVKDENGEIVGIYGVVTSVGTDAHAEEKLRESEERFRLIADSAPVPIWVTKLDRSRSFVNRAYIDFLGITYEQAVNYDWRNIIHPDDAPRILAESLAGEATLEPFVLEGRFRRSDGEMRWLRSISQPRWGPSGEHIGFIGVASDITEWKQATETLRQVNEMLERKVEERTSDLKEAIDRLQAEVAERERAEEALRQAQKMEAVGRLTGGIAHDFNNLLTPIIGGLELIVDNLEDERLLRLARGALESSRRGAKLTTQLLAFSRIQRLKMAPVALNQVIGNLRQILHHTIGGEIEIRTALDPRCGNALCDENQLENAILNLAINARDAMPSGGTLTISTGLVREPGDGDVEAGDYAMIAVADTGHGMTPEILLRAAEPFFSTKPFGKGTGLGLAQVHGIAHQSGGTVRIESREGEGTIVTLLFPSVDAATEQEPVAPGARDLVGEESVGARILIVDDDDDVRAFLTDVLVGQGHRIEAVDGAEPALAAIERGVPDLVLIDFAMPGTNGAQLAAMIRDRRHDLPIAFITGFSESDQIEEAVGPDVPILRKPFGVDDLRRLVAETLVPRS
jgi:PAS domain S-box-containing protein